MNVSVGTRVEIWWDSDMCWYPGDIIAVNGVNAVVSYEDGASLERTFISRLFFFRSDE